MSKKEKILELVEAIIVEAQLTGGYIYLSPGDYDKLDALQTELRQTLDEMENEHLMSNSRIAN